MNDREISELRRRFKADKNNIDRVYGCCVNEKGEIADTFSQSFFDMNEEETESLLSILRRSLSGEIGRNLNDIAFTNQQVTDSDEHRLMMALRDGTDENALKTLYETVASAYHTDGRYLILLVRDTYDVFSYGKDGNQEADSSSVFRYFVCCICPIKQSRSALSFAAAREHAFRGIAGNSVVSAPELGFVFPAFDERKTNIYNALFYTKNTATAYDDFVGTLFRTEVPMPAGIQKQTFTAVLSESVRDECGMEVVEAVREQVTDLIGAHKAAREREPLRISKKVISEVLESCEVAPERIEAFSQKYDEAFGKGTEVPPQNIVETKRYELETPDVAVRVNPDRTDLVTTRVIDGVKYILIRADETVSLNGVNIHIS